MPGPNPWDNDPVVGTVDQAAVGRPVIRKGTPPVSPTEQYHPITPQERQAIGLGPNVPAVVSDTGKPDVIGGDKTNYRPMTVQEKTTNHLSPDAPWLMGTNGEFKLPDGYKPAENANGTAEKQQALDAADSLIQGVHKARSFVNDGYDIPVVGNTATGLGYNVLRHSPVPTDASKLEGVINQEIRGNIFLKRIADLKQAAADDGSTTGGTGIGRIMQAEIPLITGAIGTLDPGKLGKQETLNSLAQIERSALRSKAIINGENPDDPAVQKKYGIPALPSYPNGNLPGATPPSGAPPSSGGGSAGGPPPIMPSGGDNGITKSAELPAIMGGPGMAASGGQTKAVTDPQLAKVAPQLEQYLAADPRKVSNAMILGFLQKNGVDPSRLSQSLYPALQYRMSKEGAAWRARGGNYVVSPTYDIPMSQSEKDSNYLSQSAPAAGLINAGDAATAGNLDKLLPAQATDNALAVANAEHPVASTLGQLAGATTVALGGEGALARLGFSKPVAALLADTGYGTAVGGTHSDNPLLGGIEGAALGLGGNLAGRGVAKGLGAMLDGVTNPSVSYVNREVPGSLTLGQAVGGKLKGVEDRLSGLPVLGDVVNARRLEGLQKMNSKAFDRALEPIGGSAGGKFGEEAVANAQDQVGQAFDKALSGKSAHLDMPFIVDGAKAKMALDKLPDSVSSDVEKLVDGVMNDHFSDTGQLTGENLQSALRQIADIKGKYASSPAGHRIGDVLDEFSNSLEGLFQRQAPEVMPRYNAAKKAAQRLYTLQDAVLKAKNTNGVFTPGQLGLADRSNTIAYGGRNKAAAGGGEFHDFQRNMQEVLPNKVPDSGTAGRLILPLAALGVGGAGGEVEGDLGKGLTLGGLLALAYSRMGQRALTAAVLKRGTASRAGGAIVRKSAPLLGHAGASQASLGIQRD